MISRHRHNDGDDDNNNNSNNNNNNNNLQGLGLLTCSDLPVRRIDPAIFSVVDLYLVFL
jgi:hypothetical protein